ncbi:MAG: AraC family transcriptional regulator [Synergistaceae bacterium]
MEKRKKGFHNYTLKGTESAIEYIHKNIYSSIRIADLAEKYDISPSAFKRCFKEKMGVPVYTYIRKTKMNKAAEMLTSTNMSVTDVAQEVGFLNTSKFSSAFKDVMGEYPSLYRDKFSF